MNEHTRSADPLDPEVPPEARDRALKLWVVLARAYAAVHAHAAADIDRHGLTMAEFGILETLYHKGPMLLGEVQRRILVSSGGITYLVDRLAAKGLAERRNSPHDRRARLAALTPAGEELIRRVFPDHIRCIEHALSSLDADDQATVTRLLRVLGLGAAERSPLFEEDG